MIDFLSLHAIDTTSGRVFMFENKDYSLKGIYAKLTEYGLTEKNIIEIISLKCKNVNKELL
jgi:hypothetical protein